MHSEFSKYVEAICSDDSRGASPTAENLGEERHSHQRSPRFTANGSRVMDYQSAECCRKDSGEKIAFHGLL